ncbi:MAG: DUF4440 domain-containing protein [Planctomycetes bacterium]|nr:DUF4440 domain-containing protein [Planctomycetota bacterium]
MKWLPLLAVITCACRALDSEPRASLLAADRAFAADTRERRLEGWLAAFDLHGSQVDDAFRPVTGAAAIREHMGAFFADPRNHLSWEPDEARVSEAGHLGTTTGRFEWRGVDEQGRELVLTGRYFDVWRRTEDGTWKLLYDIGEPDDAGGR